MLFEPSADETSEVSWLAKGGTNISCCWRYHSQCEYRFDSYVSAKFVTPLFQQHDVSQSSYEAVSEFTCCTQLRPHWNAHVSLSDSGASSISRHHGYIIKPFMLCANMFELFFHMPPVLWHLRLKAFACSKLTLCFHRAVFGVAINECSNRSSCCFWLLWGLDFDLWARK